MTGQYSFLLAVYAAGLLLARRALGPRNPDLVVSLAFPIGLGAWCAMAWTTLYLGIPYSALSARVMTVSLVLAGIVLNVRRGGFQRAEAVWIAGGSFVFAVAAMLADRVNCVLLSADSFHFLQLGRAFAFDGAVSADSWMVLASWGVLPSIIQSVSVFVGLDYIYAVQPLLGVSLVLSLFIFARIGLREVHVCRTAATMHAVLGAAFLGTTYFIVHQSFYIHTNLLSAVYFLPFCGLVWVGRVQRRQGPVVLGMACLVPFTLCRTEAPLFALVFLVTMFADDVLPRRTTLPCLAAYAGFTLAWYARLFVMIGEGSEILTRGKIALLLLPVLGYTAVMALPKRAPLDMIRTKLPEIMLLLLSIGLLAVVVVRRDHMASSFYAFVHNLFGHGLWGVMWIALLGLLVLVYHAPRLPGGKVFEIAMPCFLLILLALAAARIPYRVGWGDSANRILTHLVPVIILYLTMRFGMTHAPPRASAVAPE